MDKLLKNFISNNTFLLIAVIIYLLIKVMIIYFIPNVDLTVDDSSTYISFAQSLKHYSLIETFFNEKNLNLFFRTPIFPFLVYLLDGSIKAISFTQSLIWVILCLLLFSRESKNKDYLYYFLIIYFLYHPNIFYHTSVILPETIFVMCVSLGILFLNLSDFNNEKSFRYVIIFYFFICVSTLIKPVSYYLVYIFFLFFLFVMRNHKNFKLFIFCCLIIFISTTGLWCFRNYYLFDSFSLSYVDKYNFIHYIADRLYNGKFGEGSNYLISKFSYEENYLLKLNLMYEDSKSIIFNNKLSLLKNHIIGLLKMLFSPGDSLIYHLFEKSRLSALDMLLQKKITPSSILFFISFFSIPFLYIVSFTVFLNNYSNKPIQIFIIIFLILFFYFLAVSSHYDSYSRFRLPIEILLITFILRLRYIK